MDLGRRCAATFAGSVTFTNNGCPVCMHSDTHPRDIDGEEGSAVFAGEHTSGLERLSAPAIKPENPISL